VLCHSQQLPTKTGISEAGKNIGLVARNRRRGKDGMVLSDLLEIRIVTGSVNY